MTANDDQAVVLSGGGATGAYEVGVLQGLFEKDGFEPGIYTGTSVGSFNAAFMASPRAEETGAATLARLQEVWSDVIAGRSEIGGNGVFRIRGDVVPFLRSSVLARDPLKPLTELAGDALFLTSDTVSRVVHFGRMLSRSLPSDLGDLLRIPDLAALISTTPFDELIRSQIDLPRLRGSKLDFRCIATDWTHMKPTVFTKDEMTDEQGHDIVRASAAIPAIFPEVVIGGIHYVDGGILMNTPLHPAIDAWRGRPDRGTRLTLHVVYLDPAWSELPLPDVPSTLDITVRLVTSILAYNVNTHIESAARDNPAIRRQLAEDGIDEDASAEAASAAGLDHPVLEIHKYRPSASATGGLPGVLEFTSQRIETLIEQGYVDALGHDCRLEGCVLPS